MRENIEVSEALKKRLEVVITNLVVNEWTSSFLFTNIGAFDAACYEIVSKQKRIFPDIRRQYVSGDCEHDAFERERLSSLYETSILSDEEGSISYELRDKAMIDMCDVLVTYCDINYQLTAKWLSSTAMAIAYAWKKKKRIINLIS